MCKCDNCGKTFDEPRRIKSYLTEAWGHSIYETISVCPFCGDDSIDFEYEETEEVE